MKDIHGQAIWDFYKGDHEAQLTLHNSYGDPEEMPVAVFFRDHQDYTDLENMAITHCQGKILDVGAGAGAHALFMQAFDMDVSALEISPGCIDTLRHSGMSTIIEEPFESHQGQYDTLLFLMNGLGLAGKIDQLPIFFEHCRRLLRPGGQVLLDSSDLTYLYDEHLPLPDHYFGEIRYQYEYKGKKGDWFDWLYVDPDRLVEETRRLGLSTEILIQDEYDQYLACITGF